MPIAVYPDNVPRVRQRAALESNLADGAASGTVPFAGGGARVLARRYRLGRPLGVGGHGEVWEAEDLVLGHLVAIKLMRSDADLEPARVRREIAALRLLSLPGVVRLLDEGTDDGGRPFFVMDRVDGAPFPGETDRANERRLAWSVIADRTIALLEIVARVHAAGVVHRDLKPANVLVSAEGRPTVLDFGLSRGKPLGGDLTMGGQVLGTPAYLAPEQILGQAIDARTDLYAIGVMIYESLSGRRPVEADDFESLYRAHLISERRPLAEVAPEVPRAVAGVVDRMLARSPDHRPRSCAEAIGDLSSPTARRASPTDRTTLPWLGSDAPIRAVVEAARARRAIDVVGPRGSGRSRCLDEAGAVLEGEGFEVIRVGVSSRPFSGLEPVTRALEDHSSFTLDEAITHVDRALRESLARGVVVLADDTDRIDRWSGAALDRCRDAGAVVRAMSVATPGAAALDPIDERSLRALFVGPDRLFHLREDAARELWDRTLGLPARVADEIAAWMRAGLARADSRRIAMDRDALDRLASGVIVAAPHARSAGVVREDTAHVEDLLMWMTLAGSRVTPAALATAKGQPRWRVEAEIEELLLAGAARRRSDGRVEATRQADAAWTAARRREAHAAIARAAKPGDEGRLYQLIAADDGDAIFEEAIELGRRRAVEGRLGAAAAALEEGIHAARRSAGDEAKILAEWVKVALADGTPKALDRVMYELCRASDRDAAAHLEGLVGAAIAMVAVSGERALAMADALAPFEDPELEQRRHRVRLMAARRCADPRVHATLPAIEAWATRSSAIEARVTLAEGVGFLRYEEGRFAEAALRHAEAAEADQFVITRIGAMINAASSLMEAFRHRDAADRAARAEKLAAGCRHAHYEARAAWLGRAARYRMGESLNLDHELVAACPHVGVLDLEANVCLVEGAIAHRRGELSIAAEFADRAARVWRRMDKGWAEILGLGLAMAARRSATDDEANEVVARAIKSRVPGLGAQVLGLAAIARPDLRDAWRGSMDVMSATIPREQWHLCMDLTSIDEARRAFA